MVGDKRTRHIVIAEFRPNIPSDFVWEPLWLRPGHAAEQLGIDLAAATEQLRLLYPPEECRRLADLGHSDVIGGLFWGESWNDAVAHVLCLGADLHVCTGWRDHHELVHDLRHREHEDGARFEVGLWAGLTRVGANPTFLDPDQRKKAPDLRLEADGRVIVIEAKAGGTANSQRNFALLYRAISDAATLGAAFDMRHLLRFFPDAELVEAFRSLEPRAFNKKYGKRVRQDLGAWYRGRVSEYAIGPLSEVPGLGHARLLSPPMDWHESTPWDVDIVGLAPGGSEKEVTRAGRKAREAGAQLAAQDDADVRVAVVWASSVDVPATEVIYDLALSLQVHRVPPRGVDWLVLFNSHAARTGRWSPAVAASRLSNCDYDIRETAWYAGLTAWKGAM